VTEGDLFTSLTRRWNLPLRSSTVMAHGSLRRSSRRKPMRWRRQSDVKCPASSRSIGLAMGARTSPSSVVVHAFEATPWNAGAPCADCRIPSGAGAGSAALSGRVRRIEAVSRFRLRNVEFRTPVDPTPCQRRTCASGRSSGESAAGRRVFSAERRNTVHRQRRPLARRVEHALASECDPGGFDAAASERIDISRRFLTNYEARFDERL
jgi:hypothetical protein